MSIQKYILIYLLLVFVNNHGLAQQDVAMYRITYSVNHLIDTGNIGSMLKYPLYLFIGEKTTMSISKNQYINDSMNTVFKKMAKKNPNSLIIDNSKGTVKRISAFESAVIYTDMQMGIFYEKNSIGTNRFLIEDSLNKVDWQLFNNYKDISGYKCQKAKAVIKCRTWTVWFSNDLPVSSGPWKLHGLPGLILEAHDDQNHIFYEASEIELNEKNNIIELPKNGFTKCSYKEFIRLLSVFADNPIAFIENQTGFNILNNGNAPPFDVPKLKVPNNPIEKCSD